MIMHAHTSLATLAAPPTPSGGAGVLEVGQVHRPLLSTEEQVAAQFDDGDDDAMMKMMMMVMMTTMMMTMMMTMMR